MPSDADSVTYPDAQGTIVCWECDEVTGDFVQVPIPVSWRTPCTVRICQACYQSCYLPLVRDALSESGTAAVVN
jgi:hypothetical protein